MQFYAHLFLTRSIFVRAKNISGKYCREDWTTFYTKYSFPINVKKWSNTQDLHIFVTRFLILQIATFFRDVRV
jgi:hypothetical protein